jgi:hypothetical protein
VLVPVRLILLLVVVIFAPDNARAGLDEVDPAVTEISPPVEEIEVVRVVFAELVNVMFPPARKFPVGPRVVPPLIVNAPAEFKTPEPE